MRVLTFSFLRNFRVKLSLNNLYKKFSVDPSGKVDVKKAIVTGDPSFVEILPSWKPDEEVELRSAVVKHMRVIPNFVSEEEEASLLAEVEPQLKRMRYEYDHWDNAIEGYRETERTKWNNKNSEVLARVKDIAFPPGAQLLSHAHVLDLAAAGHIKPHVDAVRFCGDTIAGVCLSSSALMELTEAARPHLALHALLQRRCLYVMSGVARYEFQHAVLVGEHSVWRGEKIVKKRRVAVICREQPRPEHKQ